MNDEEIFHEALARDPADRGAYLDRACAGDPAVRASVEALLRAGVGASGFMASPAPGITVDLPANTECPGAVVGPYKLLEQIGEGGFGVVYMAEQTQPVRRKVALKVLKPGMDTRQVVARFEAERQALAIMDHPNIARVFDGGATDSGRPYFVMELVKGVPITDFCDRNHLTPRQRLELFVGVCQAVQHAHMKGIIHRDLKPTNVLVTVHDTAPVVKVIDFGVAKALGQALTEKTLFTGFAQMIGTPLYMSPEQAGQSGLDVDTRSDIYSLGVLLYELLTGSTPFDKERFKQAAYDEIRRIIREEEPPKPSTRLSDLGRPGEPTRTGGAAGPAGQEQPTASLASVSASRHTEPAKLTKLFRGEVDWIVMKALEKDRSRRYETAGAFATDVQRYLADEPVLACPPSAGYRFRKFARRHKGPLAAAGLVAAALVATVLALAVSTVLVGRQKALAEAAYQAEAQQRQRADARSEMAWRAADDMYTQVAEKWLEDQAELQLVQREFLEKALAIYQEFAREDAANPAVRERTAKAHARVGAIQAKLGDLTAAEQAFARAADQFATLVQDVTGEPRYRRELATTLVAQAVVVSNSGRKSDAMKPGRRALELQTALAEEFPGVPEYQHDLALTLFLSGSGMGVEGDLYRARAIQERLVAEYPAVAEYRYCLGTNHFHRARLLDATGRPAEADQARREAERLLRGLAEEHPHVPKYRAELSNVYVEMTSRMAPAEAEQTLRKAVAIQEKLVADHPDIPNWGYTLAKGLRAMANLKRRTGRAAEAEADYRRAIAILQGLVARSPAVGYFRALLAAVHVDLGDLTRAEEAEAAYRQAILLLELRKTSLGPDHPDTLMSMSNLASSYNALGRYADALKLFDETLALQKAKLGPDHPDTLRSMHNQARSYRGLGRHADALKLSEETLALRKAKLGADHPDTLRSMMGLVNSYAALGRHPEAVKLGEQTLALQKAKLGPEHPDTLVSMKNLSNSYAALGQHADGFAYAKKAVELQPRSEYAWQALGWAHYRAGAWRESIETLEKSCKLHKRGTGDCGQWIVLALAHARLAAQDGLPEQDRAHHQAEARRWYEQAVKQIDKWGSRPSHATGQAIWDFRAEARNLMSAKEIKK